MSFLGKRRLALAIPALLLVTLLLPASAQASAQAWQPPPPDEGMPWPEALGRFVGIWLTNLGIDFKKAVASVFWFLEKLAAAFSGLLMEENLWQTLREGLLNVLGGVMPGALRELILGNTGLLYIALMLAGVLMTIPLMGESRPVQAWRVVVWGMIVMALFISGTFGYDLIGLFEDLRVRAMQTVAAAVGARTGLDVLVARPMRATEEEVNELSFELPAGFVQAYFPEPGDEDYEDVEVVFFDGILGFSATIRMEREESLLERARLSNTGVGVAALTLVSAWVVLLFGIVFAVLTAGALMLVVFFVAALPLGFFEFGVTILSGIVRQYLYIFALSLLIAALAGLLAGVAAQAFPEGGVVDVAGMVVYLPTLVIVGLMMQYMVKMAGTMLMGTVGLLQHAVTSVGTMAYVGAPKVASGDSGMLGKAAQAAAGIGLAAATGGTSMALMAGAGALLSGTKFGGAAAQVAGATGGKHAHVFAATARARGVADTAAGVIATGVRFRQIEEQDRARGERAFRAEVQRESRHLDPRWQAVDAGAFLTVDLGALERAERAFFGGEQRQARRHLERAFGSREVADEVIGVYRRDGKKGAARVRQVVELTQTAALQMAAAGRPVFDERGEATQGFQRTVRGRLAQAGLVDERNEQDAAFVGRLAGAVVRRPIGIWADPEAARKLARDTLEPEATEVAAGDLSAQHRLRDLALRLRWDAGQLEALFEAVRDGRAAALRSGRSVEEEVSDALAQMGGFRDVPMADRREAARLAVMVAEGAQVQQQVRVPLEPRAMPLAAATFDEGAYRRAVDAYYVQGDEAGAREALVEATGSVDAAERLVAAFGKHPRSEAEALPRYVEHVVEIAPSFDAQGTPTPEYRQEIVKATSTTAPLDGGAMFDEVADDLLYRFDERWTERADELAEAVMRGDGGRRAEALRREAQQQGWDKAELAALMRQAVQEAGNNSRGQEAATLALARDAMREVDSGGISGK